MTRPFWIVTLCCVLDRVAAAVRECGGKIVRSVAGSVMASFAQPRDAVKAAVRMQNERLAETRDLPLPGTAERRRRCRSRVRIGMGESW